MIQDFEWVLHVGNKEGLKLSGIVYPKLLRLPVGSCNTGQ